ncbi:hypothetical protein CEP53_001409 [Fusarium sp. AF-6]|nr:hypothetical protein CEP53_001409 [Fusarium sp. AF-6]
MTPALALPSIRVHAKQANLEITATPSLCVDLPDDLPPVATIDELAAVVKDAHIWIARTGTCCIEISIAVSGRPILQNDHLQKTTELIQHCQVWNRLGLQLEHNKDSVATLPGLLSFSIQHPDLTSALVAPQTARTSPFRTLILPISISTPADSHDLDNKPSKRRRKTGKLKGKGCQETTEENNLLATLEVDDQRAIENFMSSLNFPQNKNKRKRHITCRESDDEAACLKVLETLRSLSLVDILLEQLMLAPEKKYRGYQVWGGSSTHCLTKLAPGVFHMPYLSKISDRAQLLPVIATCLARMKNAESPALRQKVTDLKRDDIDPRKPYNEWEDTVQVIEKRAWDVLLATTEVPWATERRQAKKPVRPIPSSRQINQQQLAPMPPKMDMGEAYTNVETEKEGQEHPALRVNWEVIHNSPGLVTSENSMYGCESSNTVAVGFRNDSWTSPYGYLGSSTLPEWTKNGYGKGEQVAEMPLTHGWDSAVSVKQIPPGMEVMVADNTVYDPGSLNSAENWIFCNERI